MKKHLLTGAMSAIMGFLSACASGSFLESSLKVPPELASAADIYEVSGRKEFRWKRQLAFGDYTANEVEKTFPSLTGTELEFLDFGGAQQKFNISLEHNSTGVVASVLARHDLKTSGVNLRAVLPQSSTLTLSAQDNLTGVVDIAGEGPGWKFHMANLAVASYRLATGDASNGQDTIHMEEITEVDGIWKPGESGEPLFLGLLFKMGDRPIGAVQYHHGGKIWISRNISPEVQDIVAALSTIVLLKEDN